MAFYLKYRSRKLEELDLKLVRERLTEIVRSGNIPHALLFSGPKGTGKTSAARILAKIINCENIKKGSVEPCNKCGQCRLIESGGNIDVIEMDAASNRGIDDIRTLRDAVKLSPAKARKKVYVIDEAHMLTTEASNALLKTLEEPPEHVVFILATTNPEKLIGTIRSRTTEIKFGKAIPEEIVRSLNRVVKGEKIKADEEALYLIAENADGSFRDAHKLIEQLSVGNKRITKDLVQERLNTASFDDLKSFLNLLVIRDRKGLLEYIERISESGADIKFFIESVMKELKRVLLLRNGIGDGEDIDFKIEELIDLIRYLDSAYEKVGITVIEQLPLEISIIEWCEKYSPGDFGGENEKKDDSKKSVKYKGTSEINSNLLKKTNGEMKNVGHNREKNGTVSSNIVSELWKEILLLIKTKNTSTEALLRAAKPIELVDDVLTVGVFYNFHKERLEHHLHRNILEDALHEATGRDIKIMCELTEPPHKTELVEVENNTTGDELNNGEIEHSVQESEVLTKKADDDIVKIAEEIFG